MFTGLVATTGVIEKRRLFGEEGELTVRPKIAFDAPKTGESVAVNGACLTLTEATSTGVLTFQVLAETFKRTNLGDLAIGARVNLERALAFGERLGGHLVQGHVDAAGVVKAWETVGRDRVLWVRVPSEYRPYLIEKGSVALDGVSLTVVGLTDDCVSVHLIPTTVAETCLTDRGPGDKINVETDLIGKYVLGFLRNAPTAAGLSMETLRRAGWE